MLIFSEFFVVYSPDGGHDLARDVTLQMNEHPPSSPLPRPPSGQPARDEQLYCSQNICRSTSKILLRRNFVLSPSGCSGIVDEK